MKSTLIFWIYLVNAVILLVHEIDSAYWQEWKLINPNDNNGINGFLIIHIPMIFAILYGLVLLDRGSFAGLIISLILALSGLFAFFFHLYFLKTGHPEFNTIVSKSMIFATLLLSSFQIVLSLRMLIK